MVAIVGLSSTIVAAVIGLGSQLDPNDGLGAIHSTLVVVTLIFAGVAFISWLYRARVNLYYFGVPDLRWKSGWTIWSWFVPFANFVIPVRVINEVDRASERRADFADGGRGRPPYGRVVFVLWAITWTGYVLLDRYPRAGTPSLIDLPARNLDNFGALSVVSTALEIAAAVCAILLVRRVTANQDRALATLLAGMPAGMPGAPAHPVPSQVAAYAEPYRQTPYPPPSYPPPSYPQTLRQPTLHEPTPNQPTLREPTPYQPTSDPQAWAGVEAPPSQRPPTAPRPDPLEEPPPPASDPWPSAGF
jgi:hypothetical protein